MPESAYRNVKKTRTHVGFGVHIDLYFSSAIHYSHGHPVTWDNRIWTVSVPPEKRTLCPCVGGQRQVSVQGGRIPGQYNSLLQPETENWLMCFNSVSEFCP